MRSRAFVARMVAPLLIAAAAPSLAQPDYSSPSDGQTDYQSPPPQPLQNPDQAGRANVQSAASAPLHDLNLTRARIPPVLIEAMHDPYARPSPATCAKLADDVDRLTMALGNDLDTPPAGSRTMGQKSGSLGLSLIHTVAESLLPYSGIFRTLSGAEKHDRLVVAAILAGSTRRGYLKGLGEARRCVPPATPRHYIGMGPAPEQHDIRPEYPIR